MRASLTVAAVLIGTLFAVACGQSTSPTIPTAGTSASAASAGNGSVVPLSTTVGTAYTLTGFNDFNCGFLFSIDFCELSGTNKQGSFTGFTQLTEFRNAQLDKYDPADPCRSYASDYNSALLAPFGEREQRLKLALAALANGCNARVVLYPTSTYPRIRTFQPIP